MNFEKYDGTTDPSYHIANYISAMVSKMHRYVYMSRVLHDP